MAKLRAAFLFSLIGAEGLIGGEKHPVLEKRLSRRNPQAKTRRFLLRCALLLAAVSPRAEADWAIVDASSEPAAGGGVHRHVVCENGGRVVVDLAIFSPRSCGVRLIENRAGQNLADALSGNGFVAGVNGGYFDAEFAPIGLRIREGKIISPLRRARLLTGVLVASPGIVRILRTREFSPSQKAETALQCGPFLVDHGRRVAGLDRLRAARRTFAATAADSRAALGVCSEISLADLGALLATTQITENFKVEQALNFDGGSSSAFWFKRKEGNSFSIAEQKSVRDFVGIAAK